MVACRGSSGNRILPLSIYAPIDNTQGDFSSTIASIFCFSAPQCRFILSLDSMAPFAVHMEVAVSDRWIFCLCFLPSRSRSIRSKVLPESRSQGPPIGRAMAGPAIAPGLAYAFSLALLLGFFEGLLFPSPFSWSPGDGTFAPLPFCITAAAGRQCGKGHFRLSRILPLYSRTDTVDYGSDCMNFRHDTSLSSGSGRYRSAGLLLFGPEEL